MSAAQLQALVTCAWETFDQALTNANRVVVQPSMPILYFGDRMAYERSPLKIITVGLNPSLKEFPSDDPWLRFPAGRDLATYLDSLNAYFRTQPYRNWFDAFEPILRGMSATYYPGGECIAVHTDICSPIATNPTWGELRERRALVGDGFPLWRALVEVLKPDVVVISVAARYLLRLTNEPVEGWPAIHVLERKNAYHVRMRELRIGHHRTCVVFGRAAQKPFGTVPDRHKPAIGAAIRSAILDR